MEDTDVVGKKAGVVGAYLPDASCLLSGELCAVRRDAAPLMATDRGRL